MKMTYNPGRWEGNQWASIEITPVDAAAIPPLLQLLTDAYGLEAPELIDHLEGTGADFEIDDIQCTMDFDGESFSLAFEDEPLRDEVLDLLLAHGGEFPDAGGI